MKAAGCEGAEYRFHGTFVGKIAVSKVLSLGRDDVKTFEKLKAKGIQFDVRKVPNDSKENMDDIIKKAKAELA